MVAQNVAYEEFASGFVAPKAKILLVDDNEMNRRVFVELLKESRIQITEADSGAECLRLTKEHAYDLIFLDHMMPEMDGIETRRNMLSDEGNLWSAGADRHADRQCDCGGKGKVSGRGLL